MNLNQKISTDLPKHPGGRRNLISPFADSEHQSRSRLSSIKKMENVITNRFKKAGNKSRLSKPKPDSGLLDIKAPKPKIDEPSIPIMPATSLDKEPVSIDKLLSAEYQWVLPCIRERKFGGVVDKFVFRVILERLIEQADNKSLFVEIKNEYDKFLFNEKKENVVGMLKLINEIRERGYEAVKY